MTPQEALDHLRSLTDPTPLQLREGSLPDILDQVRLGGDACMIWPRSLCRGYGRVYIGKQKLYAHRWVYEQIIGPIPEGLFVCHRCDVKACVNPNHLYVGTHADNMRDAVERGRTAFALHPETIRASGRRLGLENAARAWSRGEANTKAKLTEDDARAIKRSKERTKVLMTAYGVSKGTIQKIRRGELWKHV